MKRFRHSAPRGLTLIELIVVLVILSTLAIVALRGTEGIADQARFEASQDVIDNLDYAIFGESGTTDASGRVLVSGFIADMGRPPIAFGDDAALQLRELWDNDLDDNGIEDFVPFGVQNPAADSNVRVLAGWRGPYLRLAPGAHMLSDGWGEPLQIRRSDEANVLDGELVEIVRSLGRDGTNGGIDYATDLGPIVLSRDSPIEDRWQSEVDFRVHKGSIGTDPALSDGQNIVVRYYGPDVIGDVVTVEERGPLAVTMSGGPIEDGFAQLVPIGQRVFIAYQYRDGDDPTSPTLRSSDRPFLIRAGADQVDLILR